jgi:hypothetical protein
MLPDEPREMRGLAMAPPRQFVVAPPLAAHRIMGICRRQHPESATGRPPVIPPHHGAHMDAASPRQPAIVRESCATRWRADISPKAWPAGSQTDA